MIYSLTLSFIILEIVVPNISDVSDKLESKVDVSSSAVLIPLNIGSIVLEINLLLKKPFSLNKKSALSHIPSLAGCAFNKSSILLKVALLPSKDIVTPLPLFKAFIELNQEVSLLTLPVEAS